jgi:hypothetical protein
VAINNWMAWEGGVDMCAVTDSSLSMPNILIHVARLVHTPVGSAPAGMILYQPDPQGQPLAFGFISPNLAVGRYFGPNIFAGTPFEQAPVVEAGIEINVDYPHSVSSIVKIGDILFETALSGLGSLELINRPPAAMPPFAQQGLESAAQNVSLKVNGKDIRIIIPPVGISGGPGAVFSSCGVYARS